MNQYEGKTAIITGGGEGIGLSIAQALGKEKMNIVVADIDENNLENATNQLLEAGINVLALKLDVADEQQWLDVAKQAQAHFGNIHMLVNNAGIAGETGPVEQQQLSGWQWTIDVNLMGVVYGTKVITPMIKAHGEGGWIINVASMAGMGGIPYGGAYTATKTAVVGLSESWLHELKKHDIRVSVLCPGFVQTRIYDSDRYLDKDQETTEDQINEANKFRGKEFVDNGIDPAIVGARLIEALNAQEFYIFTHPGFRHVLQHRAKLLDEAMERAENSPLLQDVVHQDIKSF